MDEHPNAAVIRNLNDAMSARDMEKGARYIADDVVWHEIGSSEPIRGKAELASRSGDFGDADVTYDVHDIVANDDHVIVLGTANVTKAGKSLTYRTAEIYHVNGEQVTERWAFSDDTQAIIDFFA
jgi:ketosteroid isomerase-like protein